MTLRCLIFGHAWHNDHGWNTHIRYDEPCERRGCLAIRNPKPAEQTPTASIRSAAALLERLRLADTIHAHRFDRPSVDSFYAGMKYAEQLARGDH